MIQGLSPRRLLLFLMLPAILAAVGLMACAQEVEVAKDVPIENLVEVPETTGSLVVYSGRSKSLVGPIIEQFRDATGIDVSVKYAKTGELAATLLEEGEHSPADVFFAQDPGGLGAVSELLDTLPSEVIGLVPDWARSPDGRWVGISGRARVVVYNTRSLSEGDLPNSLAGFTGPQWKGRIGWAPTNASFQTMVSGMRALWGEERTREWLTGIQENQPKVYPQNTPIVAAVAAGEIDVGLVNHYYLYRFIKEDGEGFPARNHYLDAGGPGSLMVVAGAGILGTADNRENGERFLGFMLSKVAQQYFARQTYEYPLIGEVKTHRLLVEIDEINAPKVDMVSLSDMAGTQALLRNLGIVP